MADIPGNLSKIQVEATDFNSPVSEALAVQIGENINGLIDLFSNNKFVYNTPGSYNWTCPDGVFRVLLFGCGGGGGGGSGRGTSAETGAGGGGGAGCSPFVWMAQTTPGQVYALTVGAGGAGGVRTGSAGVNGAGGGNTVITIDGIVITFPGGAPGIGGPAGPINVGGAGGSGAADLSNGPYPVSFHNDGGAGGGFNLVAFAGVRGNRHAQSIGGAGGSATSSGGGGGGGAGFGNGGAGGFFSSAGIPGGFGAGGGGGSGSIQSFANGGNGGAGGGGILIITY